MSSFEEAVRALKAGLPAVFPTDTVYGLGVSVAHAESPQVIYDLKQRDAGKPVSWLVGGADDLDVYGRDVPEQARRLARAHWPGALTIIVKASDAVPRAFQSESGTIGLRMPASDVALSLIRAVGAPLATSSANVSGCAAPRTAEGLDAALLQKVAAVLEEGQGAGAAPSTVIDCSQGKMVIVRQGDIMADVEFTVPVDYASRDGVSRINAKIWTSTKFQGPEGAAAAEGAGAGEAEGTEKPKAIIQIVHGMSEYIDRYDDLASYLVGRGFIVCAEDHIGHGGTAASPAEYGHMPVNGGKDILLGDVDTLRRMMEANYPGVPYVLYGHSMGSFIVRSYLARYGEGLAAAVLSGTGNVPAPLSKAGRTMARALAAMRGETYRSALIDGMGAGGYGKKIENARTPLDWLSTDEAVVDAYIADEKCGFMFTVGGYATLLDLTAEVVTPECAARVPKGLPIFFVAGDGDPVGDMGAGVHAAVQLLRNAGASRVSEKIYPGMRHEIHNEIGHEQVYNDIASWIEQSI